MSIDEACMKVIDDTETNTLDLIFRDESVAESDEVREGIIVDFDREGKLEKKRHYRGTKPFGWPLIVIIIIRY